MACRLGRRQAERVAALPVRFSWRWASPRPITSHVSTEDTVAARDERQTQYALNPNDVIAAAFKAAGLPVPPKTSLGEAPRVEPGPIIAAALKAAGLAQN